MPVTTPIEPVIVAGSATMSGGAGGDVVATGGGDVGHRGDDRFPGAQLLDLAQDQVGGEGRAARAVDAQHDRHHRVVVGERAQLPGHVVRAEEGLAGEGVPAAAAADDGALGEEHGDALAAREMAARAARVVEEIDALGILPGAVTDLVEAVAELVRIGELVDQALLEGLRGGDGRGVHPGPHRLGIALARGRDPVDDLVEEAVEQGVERDLRGRRMADLGEDLGGALELAGGQEARLDAELLEPAAQEETVGVEAKQVDLARRGERERRAGRGEVVLERAVAAFAGGLEKAVHGLPGLVELGDLAAKLLRLGQAEGGVLDVERDADHGRIGAGGEKSAVEQGERGLLLGIQERQGAARGPVRAAAGRG